VAATKVHLMLQLLAIVMHFRHNNTAVLHIEEEKEGEMLPKSCIIKGAFKNAPAKLS
jgi:hypothetical protein